MKELIRREDEVKERVVNETSSTPSLRCNESYRLLDIANSHTGTTNIEIESAVSSRQMLAVISTSTYQRLNISRAQYWQWAS